MQLHSKNFRKVYYLTIIFWIGFNSLIYEIYSTKVLFLYFTETTWAVTLAITAFLAGLAFSSLTIGTLVKVNSAKNKQIIYFMQLAVCLYAFFFLKDYSLIPKIIDTPWAGVNSKIIFETVKMALMWFYLFIPAFFIGGAFPLVNGLYMASKASGTRDTGIVYFTDTLGSIFGAFAAGFYLLPVLGFQTTALVAAGLNLIIAAVLAPGKKLFILTVIIALLLLLINNFSRKPDNLLDQYPGLQNIFGQVLFQKPSPYGFITIGDVPYKGKGLFINYREMCFTTNHTSATEIGAVPSSLLPGNSSVINIGLGCGFTAQAISESPQVGHLDIIEINPVVLEAAKEMFDNDNGHVLGSPKVRVIIKNGTDFIRQTQEKYDAIIIDIEEPHIIYSSPLYTRDYAYIIHDKLKNHGILAIWAQSGMPVYGKVIYNTLKTSFKNVAVRTPQDHLVFYASDEKYDFPYRDQNEFINTQRIVNDPINEVNTIENRVLEKYFNIQSWFHLPLDYKEPYLQ